MNVTTTAVAVGTASDEYPLIQNLGPDKLYVGLDSTVSAATGVQLDVGRAINTANRVVWVVSAGTSDVRLLGRGNQIS